MFIKAKTAAKIGGAAVAAVTLAACNFTGAGSIASVWSGKHASFSLHLVDVNSGRSGSFTYADAPAGVSVTGTVVNSAATLTPQLQQLMQQAELPFECLGGGDNLNTVEGLGTLPVNPNIPPPTTFTSNTSAEFDCFAGTYRNTRGQVGVFALAIGTGGPNVGCFTILLYGPGMPYYGYYNQGLLQSGSINDTNPS